MIAHKFYSIVPITRIEQSSIWDITIAPHLLDCKTVVFFANASDVVGPSSNERSGASVKTARENGERR